MPCCSPSTTCLLCVYAPAPFPLSGGAAGWRGRCVSRFGLRPRLLGPFVFLPWLRLPVCLVDPLALRRLPRCPTLLFRRAPGRLVPLPGLRPCCLVGRLALAVFLVLLPCLFVLGSARSRYLLRVRPGPGDSFSRSPSDSLSFFLSLSL